MSAIFQTVQALHERVSRSAFRTPMLWGMLLVVFLLIYMPMLVRGGYHWDETLDFAGQGMETYVANGRWGLVLWRWVFGLGCAVWLNGLLAGGLLVAAMVVQLRVLRVEHTATEITPQNKAITEDGHEYRIELIQFVPDVYPPSDDLTLVAYRQGAPL